MLPPAILVVAAAESTTPVNLGWLGEVAPVLDLGVSGILIGLIIWLIRRREALVSSGEWVPRRELDYLRADRDARLEEKDRQIERERQISQEYRAAHETSERARELSAQQVRDAVDALRDNRRFLDAFREHIIEQRSIGDGDGDGGGDRDIARA